MCFINALNKAIELAFDKKTVDPKDPKNWFTMNGTHVLDDGDNRAESATSFIKKKTDERAQRKTNKTAVTSADYIKEQVKKQYPNAEFTVEQVGHRFYVTGKNIAPLSMTLENGDVIDSNPSKNRIKELKKYANQYKKNKNTEKLKEKGEFEVLEEREKAVKLKKDGVEFWVKKSSIKEDGSLTPSAIKEFEDSKQGKGFLDAVNAIKGENKKLNDFLNENGVHYGAPSWESDKAIGIDVEVDWYDVEKTQRVRVFIPKSQLKNGKAPWWLIKKKLAEMESELDNKRSRFGGYSYETPFTSDYEGGQSYSSYGWSNFNEN